MALLLGLVAGACTPTVEDTDPPTVEDTDADEPRRERPVWTHVSAGDVQTCAVRGNGALACWGGDEYDGLPHTSDTGAWVDHGDDYTPAGRYVEVALPAGGRGPGTWHTCAVDSNLDAACWGRHDHGQTDPAYVNGNLALTRTTSCGIRYDASIGCWGERDRGPYYDDGFTDLAAGLSTLCAVHSEGYVACFDAAEEYENRYGGPPGYFRAVGVWHHACATARGGPIECWDPVTGSSWTPPGLPVESGFLDLCVGGEDGGCALDADGRATCWGPYLTAPPDVTFTQLSCGNTHACGVTHAGEIACWGDCAHGQCDVPG